MKTKYIIAIGALGSTLGLGLPCIAATSTPQSVLVALAMLQVPYGTGQNMWVRQVEDFIT